MENILKLFFESFFRFFALGQLNFPTRTLQYLRNVIVRRFRLFAVVCDQFPSQLIDFRAAPLLYSQFTRGFDDHFLLGLRPFGHRLPLWAEPAV